MPRRTVLLDTSFILALENKDDPHHERAKALDRELLKANGILLLHWGILFEIADGYARVSRRAKALQLLGKRRSSFSTSPLRLRIAGPHSCTGI